jgi:hypothetical protein
MPQLPRNAKVPRPTTQPGLVQDDRCGLQPDPHHCTRHPTSHHLTATSALVLSPPDPEQRTVLKGALVDAVEALTDLTNPTEDDLVQLGWLVPHTLSLSTSCPVTRHVPPTADCGPSCVPTTARLRTRRSVCFGNPATPTQYAGSRQRHLAHHRVSKPTRMAVPLCCRGAINDAPWRVRGRAVRRSRLPRAPERRWVHSSCPSVDPPCPRTSVARSDQRTGEITASIPSRW